jgi:hypothetical protein
MQSLLAFLASLVALMVLASVLAWWGWRWFAPVPAAVPSSGPQDAASALLASGLFGNPQTGPVAAAEPEAALATGDTRLLGVFAEAGGKGFALFRVPAGPKLIGVGKEIAPGATLVSVQPDGVTVRDTGGERRIPLRASAAATIPPAKSIRAATVPRNPVCALPPGFKGDVLRLNAELVSGIAGQPESWASFAAADRGALTIRDDNGFTAMLAMKKGDRVEQGNGIALRAPDDLVNAVLRPLAAGQTVLLTGTRSGAAHQWLLQNAGTCS